MGPRINLTEFTKGIEAISQPDAVDVANWLGWKFYEVEKLEVCRASDGVEYYLHMLSQVLTTPESQEAIRDKLKADGLGIYEETGLTVLSWPDELAEAEDLTHAVLKLLKRVKP